MRSKPGTFLISIAIAILRYLMQVPSVERLMYFHLYRRTTFGLYPSQIVYVALAFGMLFAMTRFAIVVERRPLLWLIAVYFPIVLGSFLNTTIVEHKALHYSVVEACDYWLALTIISSIVAFPVRWWRRRKLRRVTDHAEPVDVDSAVWPPPPQT